MTRTQAQAAAREAKTRRDAEQEATPTSKRQRAPVTLSELKRRIQLTDVSKGQSAPGDADTGVDAWADARAGAEAGAGAGADDDAETGKLRAISARLRSTPRANHQHIPEAIPVATLAPEPGMDVLRGMVARGGRAGGPADNERTYTGGGGGGGGGYGGGGGGYGGGGYGGFDGKQRVSYSEAPHYGEGSTASSARRRVPSTAQYGGRLPPTATSSSIFCTVVS